MAICPWPVAAQTWTQLQLPCSNCKIKTWRSNRTTVTSCSLQRLCNETNRWCMSGQALWAVAWLLLILAVFFGASLQERLPVQASCPSSVFFLHYCAPCLTLLILTRLETVQAHDNLIGAHAQDLWNKCIGNKQSTPTGFLASPLAPHHMDLFWQWPACVDSPRLTLPAIHTFLPLSFNFSSKSVS